MKQSLFFSKIVFFSYTGDPTSFKSRSQSCYLLLFSEGSKSMRIFCFSSFLASILYVLFTFFWHTFGQLFVYTTFLAEYIGFEFDIYKFLVYIFFVVVVVANLTFFLIFFPVKNTNQLAVLVVVLVPPSSSINSTCVKGK